MVMTPPGWKMKKFMLQAELMLLDAKKKISGQLSEAEEKRRREILQLLSIKF